MVYSQNLKQFCNEYKVKGFVSVIASPRVTDGLSIVWVNEIIIFILKF